MTPPTPHTPPTPPGNGKGEPASAAAVAALAGEVEALRIAVEQLAGVDGRVEEVADLVTRLAQTVSDRIATPKPAQAGNRTWLDLPCDHREAEALLEELTEWLTVVFLRYPDGVEALPECWLWHPDVVEELLWLMEAWQAAYANPEAPVAWAGDWHDRQRPGVVRRIRAAAGSCSLDKHQAGQPLAAPPAGVPEVDAAPAVVAWWTSHRGDAPPVPENQRVAAANQRRRAAKARRHDRQHASNGDALNGKENGHVVR